MKRFVITLTLAACALASAHAETSQHAYLAPYGPWELCKYPGYEWACASATGGWYVLGYQSGAASASHFAYTITAVVEGVKDPVVVTGTFDRSDNPWGWSSTFVFLPLNGRVVSYTIHFKAYMLVGEEDASS